MNHSIQKIHIGKLLLDNHFITEEQLEQAVVRQKMTGEKLGHIIIDLGFVKEEKFLQLLSEQFHIPYIDLKNYSFNAEIVHCLPELYARRFRALVLKQDDQGLLVGVIDPQDIVMLDELSRILKRPLHLALVREEDVLQMIDVLYRRSSEITNFAQELSAEFKHNDFDLTQLGIGLSSSDAPVVKLLQSIFEDAVQVGASDIHIEPDEFILRIRQRIDGILHEHIVKEKNIASALTLRLKLMAGLNIAEKRVPQDGRFSIKIKNKNLDVRLSTIPVQFGESVVMRLLDQSAGLLNLDQIGMPEAMLKQFRRILSLPNGLVLITGPTGSGKTTTLYGALNELNTPDVKIITVEDPVEYRLPRINQIQVQPQIDLTFSRALRSVLRQDPDIMMIGELRDQETVSIALRAAMTGHFVLATLHTNDALSSAVRLIDMGAEGYLVAAVLRAVMAQRLVRRICPKCIKEASLSSQEKIWLSATANHYLTNSFKHGAGCSYCYHTGYKGQVGVFELVELNEASSLALRNRDLTALAHSVDVRSFVMNGLDLATSGLTTVSEVIRITGES